MVDNFRKETSIKLEQNKKEVKDDLIKIEKENNVLKKETTSVKKNKVEESIRKPLGTLSCF